MKRGLRVLTLATLATLALASQAAAQSWSPAGNMTIPRIGHQATPLLNGNVLVTGGFSPASGNGGYNTTATDLYDPTLNSWGSSGSTANGRNDHTAARLHNGRVVVAGGVNANICAGDTSSELYDPATGLWSFTGSLPFAAAGATSTTLLDGRILFAGGGDRCGSVFASTALYDPATGLWTLGTPMTEPREWHNAVMLANGKILVAGGLGTFPFPALSSAEIYDPITGTWTPTGSMVTARCGCGSAAFFLTLLADGRVLGADGYGNNGFNLLPNGPQAEVYDPLTGTWSATGSMGVTRASGTFSPLGDGTVLAAGGHDGSSWLSSAELWSPVTGTWSPTASMAAARYGHSRSTLANGKVLVAGGYDGANYLSSAELYEPAAARVPQHFQSYDLSQPERAGETVVLIDQFGSRTVRLEEIEWLMNPVEKRRTGHDPVPVERADEHLTCYGLPVLSVAERTVHVRNQFTGDSTLRIGRPLTLCTPAAKTASGTPGSPPEDLDHFQCYDVRGESPRFRSETLTLLDQFGTRTVRIDRTRELCNPVEKRRTGHEPETIKRPDEHLVCYRIETHTPSFSALTVFTNDQFGLDTLRVVSPRRLCVPSEKGSGPLAG